MKRNFIIIFILFVSYFTSTVYGQINFSENISKEDKITLVCKPSHGLAVSGDPWLYRNETTGEYFFRVVWGEWATYCRSHKGQVFDIYLGTKEDAIKAIESFNNIRKELDKNDEIQFTDTHNNSFIFYRQDIRFGKGYGFIWLDRKLENAFGTDIGYPRADVIHEKSFEKLLKQIDKWK